MADGVKKSHGGLKFFFGWLTGILTVVLVVGVAAIIVVQMYEPKIATTAEKLLESVASQSATSTIGITTTVDLKTVESKKEGEDYEAHFGGLASAGVLVDTPITFVAKISEDNYNKLQKNVKTGGSADKELADNYGLKGIIYTAIAMSDSTTDGKYIYFNGHDIPWTMNSAGSSSSSSSLASSSAGV